jgi:hypothetical protein
MGEILVIIGLALVILVAFRVLRSRSRKGGRDHP